jgi:hypothetical protein
MWFALGLVWAMSLAYTGASTQRSAITAKMAPKNSAPWLRRRRIHASLYGPTPGGSLASSALSSTGRSVENAVPGVPAAGSTAMGS